MSIVSMLATERQHLGRIALHRQQSAVALAAMQRGHIVALIGAVRHLEQRMPRAHGIDLDRGGKRKFDQGKFGR
ncbi:hypothetical protein D3C72_2214750 [compost metagenome]